MNGKTALIKLFLSGEVVNIKNCFKEVGFSNCSRECIRQIEKPFNVTLHREHRKGKSRWGVDVTWTDYSLKRTNENQQGIFEMSKYVLDNGGNPKKGKITNKK
jgi:hypothetical protein